MTVEPEDVSPRNRRSLRAIMPVGVVLLIVWLVWHGWWFVTGASGGPSVVSAVLGLVSSVILIVTGREYRRTLPPR